jgi:hypothetical protein
VKNKKQIYILLPVVLLVWGLIGFRIYKAMSGGSDETVVYQTGPQFVEKTSDTIAVYKLKLDYVDPFLKKRNTYVAGGTGLTNPSKRVKPKVKVKKTVIPLRWPVINYKGLIQKTKGDVSLYILEIDGVSHFLSVGDEQQQLKLLRADADSIRLEFQGKEKRTVVKL